MRAFSVPAGIVVNKWDLNPESTEAIDVLARERGLQLRGTASVRRLFTHAQMAGLPVPLFPADPDSLTERIETLWKETKTWIGR